MLQVSPLGGAKGFSLTPNISLTLGNFSKKISPPYTSPLALQIPLLISTKFTSGWGWEPPPEKIFFDPQLKKFCYFIPSKFCTAIRQGVLYHPPKFGSDPNGEN